MTQLEKIKEKLAKLKSHQLSADQVGNEEEAASFAAKIQELLQKYELEMGDIEEHVTESIEVGQEKIDISTMQLRNEGRWAQQLFHGVARSNNCIVLTYSNNKDKILIIGHQLNREAVKFIVSSLEPQIRALARSSWASYSKGPHNEKRNTYIRGFMLGACQTIATRLWDDFTRNKWELAGYNDLVLNKQAAVDNYLAKHFPKLGRGKGITSSSQAGRHAGIEAGHRVGLKRGNLGAGGTRLLGS